MLTKDRSQEYFLGSKDNNYTKLENILDKTDDRIYKNALNKQKDLKSLSVSIVIPAKNVESSILTCLTSIEHSSFNLKFPNKLEVIVVDDGSTDNTWQLVAYSKFNLNLTTIRQKPSGQAQALNTGISISEGDIIISCDADMVLSFNTIKRFLIKHQTLPKNVLLAGFRSDIPTTDLRVNRKYILKNGVHQYSEFHNDERFNFPVPGWPDNMYLTSNAYKNLGHKKGLWMRKEDPWLLPDLVFGALFSLPRSVYSKIGGYDERFVGWGCTDGYLASKAVAVGCYIIPVISASGLHISHPARSEDKKQKEYLKNRKLFKKLIKDSKPDNFPNWLHKASQKILEVKRPTFIKKNLNSNSLESKENKPKYLQIDSLLALGKYVEATKMISKHTTKNSHISFKLAKAKYGSRRYNEAIAILQTLPKNEEVIILLSRSYSAISRYKKAHKIFKDFPITKKNEIKYSFWLKSQAKDHLWQGNQYLNQDFFETAKKCFENVLIIDPKNTSARKKHNICIDKLSATKKDK